MNSIRRDIRRPRPLQEAARRAAVIRRANRRAAGAVTPVRRAMSRRRSTFKAKAEAKEITFDQQIPAGCEVTAHREGLFHVFENLLDNDVKHSPRKRVIRLASKTREDGRMELSVEDQGPGIPKEVQNRVFERFFRVDVSRSREAGGTGLGLAIVKHLMDKMRGEVALTSEEGKGSVFTLILPKPSI